MFPNNRPGDPNQQNQSSVFGYEMYPPPNTQPINWPEVQQGINNPHTHQFQSQVTQNEMGNFSFSSQRPDQPVVQFPFQVGSSFGVNTSAIRCKRKTESPPLQQSKQHITEEKMAEHMSKLHISSETPPFKETSSEKQQRLYMCEEMRKLKSEVLIPQCLIDRMQRPCTALVLWQPPPRILGIPDRLDNVDNNNEDNLPDHQLRMENENVEYDMDM